jgi:1-phosphatidylinositol phosphodiesterase
MQLKRKENASHNFLTVSLSISKTAAKIVVLTLILFFLQAGVPSDWSRSMEASIAKPITLTPAPQSGGFQFMDESGQPGGNFNTGSSPNAWIKTANNNWMAALPDSTSLKSISLPGTHDSGARVSGLAVQTQSWTIKDQLEAGIRFLDIRTRRTKDSLAIHHSSIFLGMMFGDVMNAVSAFLTAHPREVVVMRIRADEHTPEEGSKDFATIWANYMRQYGNFIAQNTDTNPILGRLRGKVFVLQNGWSDSTRGISYGGDTFDIQDYYQVYFLAGDGIRGTETANLPGKKKKVNEYLDRAATSTKWVLNYLSGSTGMAPPDVARVTNGEAYDHIGLNAGKKNLGTVIMDFPGEQLIHRIIKSNFAGGWARSITFKNEAGYVAKMTVVYFVTQNINGTQIPIAKALTTPAIALGSSNTLEIPRDTAKGMPISLQIDGIGAIKGIVFTTTVPEAFSGNLCFKSWGTIFDAKGGPCQ